jgi:Fe-Mn family superoxide dismutase
MAHQAKEYKLSGLDGISDNQISQHRDILYKGYVAKLNEIEEKLKAVNIATANQIQSDLRALKSDETFALNGVVLHELYFENLGGAGSKPDGGVKDLIERDFGSTDKFIAEFKACGMAARGWVVAAFSVYDMKLHTYCLDTHNYNVPVAAIPLLVMDVYEHAYVIDYGVKRPPYIEAFVKNIDWAVVARRHASIEKCISTK